MRDIEKLAKSVQQKWKSYFPRTKCNLYSRNMWASTKEHTFTFGCQSAVKKSNTAAGKMKTNWETDGFLHLKKRPKLSSPPPTFMMIKSKYIKKDLLHYNITQFSATKWSSEVPKSKWHFCHVDVFMYNILSHSIVFNWLGVLVSIQ